MTDARLAGVARESLVANTGSVRLAGVVREALIAGVGLAGRIGAQSSAKAVLSTTSAGLVLLGRVSATSAARLGTASLLLRVSGSIATRSAATAWMPTQINVAGRITTMARARLLQRGTILVTARGTAQSKAGGSLFLQAGSLRAQWGVTVNTG
jgi:hypothetical protein